MNEYLIDEALAGTRIDKCIAELDKDISRMTAQRLIEEGNVLVNDKTTKSSYKVGAGDKVSIKKIEAKEVDLKAENIPIDVLYEDNDIIVVNKPKGMVVHPAVRKSRRNTCKCDNESLQRFIIWNRRRNKATV